MLVNPDNAETLIRVYVYLLRTTQNLIVLIIYLVNRYVPYVMEVE